MCLIPRNPFPHTLRELFISIVSDNNCKFYDDLLNFLDINAGILVGSGREALYLILKTILKEGDEIIVPAFSCNVILGAIQKSGIKPVFSDVNLYSLNMELENFENFITSNTKAILVTHQFGYPAEINPIIEFCKKEDILIIEDAAPALGAKYHDKYVGTFGDVSFFSFQESKVISTIDGGMIIGSNIILKKIEKTFPNCKENSSAKYFFKSLKKYFIQSPYIYYFILNLYILIFNKYSKAGELDLELSRYSSNCKTLSNFQNNLGLQQLSNIGNILYVRNEAAKLYRKELENFEQIISIPQSDLTKRTHTYSRFPILVKDKIQFYKAVKKQGVDLGFTFSYKLPQYFSNYEKTYKNTDFIIKHILNIPISQNMDINKRIIDKIIIALNDICKQ